jgi:hypothetical protein
VETYRVKYEGREDVAAALEEAAGEEARDDADTDAGNDDTPADTREALKGNHMNSLDEQVRNRIPNISSAQFRTFSAQQKRAIIAGMPPRVNVPTYGTFPGHGVFIPCTPREAETAAADLGGFHANEAVAEGTRERRMRTNALNERDYSQGAPLSSFVPNQRIVAARGRR